MNHRPTEDAHFVARKRQYIKKRRNKRILTVAVLCAAIIVVWIFIIKAWNGISDEAPTETVTPEIQTTAFEVTTTAEREGGMYSGAETESLLLLRENITSGPLVLVSEHLGYSVPKNKPALTTVWGNKSPTYYVANATLRLASEAFFAADRMFCDYHNATSNSDYQITMGYSDAETPICCAEHATGYAFDMNVYSKGVSIKLGEAEGIYTWVYENAAKYGFVLRYPRNKTSVTGTAFDADHFRYVGLGHAEYMAENGLTLEEYIGELQKHTYGKKHLEFLYGGIQYEVFYVIMDEENECVEIEIPKDISYNVSGDNIGGVIVTLYK